MTGTSPHLRRRPILLLFNNTNYPIIIYPKREKKKIKLSSKRITAKDKKIIWGMRRRVHVVVDRDTLMSITVIANLSFLNGFANIRKWPQHRKRARSFELIASDFPG